MYRIEGGLVRSLGSENTIPDQIVFIPQGEHTINATRDGEPATVTVSLPNDKGEKLAAKLNEQLSKRNDGRRPRFDFDHAETGPNSAEPIKFSFVEDEGIKVDVKWSSAGIKALEGKDYTDFSPTVLVDEEGEIVGIPEYGALGSLVNDPAFRTMPRIAASNNLDKSKLKNKMDQEEMKKKMAEFEAMISKLKEKLSSKDEEIKALKVEASNHAESVAKAKVEAAVSAGKIARSDEETQEEFIQEIKAGNAFASKQLDRLPVLNENLEKQVVNASRSDRSSKSETLERVADSLIQAGRATNKNEAFTLAATENPDLYDAYTETLTGAK